jgi:hypothetical protein
MNRFSQFDIKISSKSFQGDKVRIAKILNKEIVVHDFKLEDSKVQAFKEKGSGKCLQLQISFNNEMHVLFTGSCGLIEAIQQIPQNQFPFSTTIIEENDRYKFT